MPVIRTLKRPIRLEPPKIKGSRFIASVAPVTSSEDIDAFLDARRKEWNDATHNCWAWRLEPGEAFRSSDDGEPSGTAGRPILQEIDGRSLQGVVCVVTRYFGGTKLGTGGLIRAYGGAAAAALDAAEIVEIPIVSSLELRFDYDLTGAVQAVLSAFGLEPRASDYGADVRLMVAVPVEAADRLVEALVEATAGRVTPRLET